MQATFLCPKVKTVIVKIKRCKIHETLSRWLKINIHIKKCEYTIYTTCEYWKVLVLKRTTVHLLFRGSV